MPIAGIMKLDVSKRNVPKLQSEELKIFQTDYMLYIICYILYACCLSDGG